jgi:hypothetical protein
MSNKKILQGHNKALESLATIVGIPIKEKITPEMFGCTKMAVDEITFASDVASDTEINHSLGEIPRYVFLLRDSMPTSTTTYNWLIAFMLLNYFSKSESVGHKHYASSPSYLAYGDSSVTCTENTIKCASESNLRLNGNYTVITMA